MTAVNVFFKSDAVHLLTDGAAYQPDGTLHSIQAKPHTLLHLNMAMVGRGASFFLWRLAAGMAERFSSFDAAIAGLPQAYDDAVGYLAPEGRAVMQRAQYQLIVAGISERTGKPAAFFFFAKPEAGVPARKVLPAEGGFLSPTSSELFDKLMDAGLDPDLPDFDPERDGLRILQEQRNLPWPIPGGGKARKIVGGFAQITTVSRDGISTKILERWPDQIGHKIAA